MHRRRGVAEEKRVFHKQKYIGITMNKTTADYYSSSILRGGPSVSAPTPARVPASAHHCALGRRRGPGIRLQPAPHPYHDLPRHATSPRAGRRQDNIWQRLGGLGAASTEGQPRHLPRAPIDGLRGHRTVTSAAPLPSTSTFIDGRPEKNERCVRPKHQQLVW